MDAGATRSSSRNRGPLRGPHFWPCRIPFRGGTFSRLPAADVRGSPQKVAHGLQSLQPTGHLRRFGLVTGADPLFETIEALGLPGDRLRPLAVGKIADGAEETGVSIGSPLQAERRGDGSERLIPVTQRDYVCVGVPSVRAGGRPVTVPVIAEPARRPTRPRHSPAICVVGPSGPLWFSWACCPFETGSWSVA